MGRIFNRPLVPGMPISFRGLIRGLLRMDYALTNMSVENGRVDWSDLGAPTIVFGDDGAGMSPQFIRNVQSITSTYTAGDGIAISLANAISANLAEGTGITLTTLEGGAIEIGLTPPDPPDPPEPGDPDYVPPCGHPGNEPGAGGGDGPGDDTEHPGDEPGAGGGDTDHPGDTPSPPSSGDCNQETP